MKDLNELFAFIEKLIADKKETEMGVDGTTVRKVDGQELLEILDRVFSNAKLLIDNRAVITEDGLDEGERHALFVVPGLRGDKNLQEDIAQMLIKAGKDGIEGFVEDFKVRKKELETRIAEGEIEEMKTEEFELAYPKEPYAGDVPEGAPPRDEVVKRRWDRGGGRLTK